MSYFNETQLHIMRELSRHSEALIHAVGKHNQYEIELASLALSQAVSLAKRSMLR